MQELDGNFQFLFDDLKMGNWNHISAHYKMDLKQIDLIIGITGDYHVLSNILTFQDIDDGIIWSIFNKENKNKFGIDKTHRMLNAFKHNKSYGRMIKKVLLELGMNGYYLVNSKVPIHTVISICKENDDIRKDVTRVLQIARQENPVRLQQQKMYVKKLLKLRNYFGD